MILFFDTETTGLPENWKAPVTDLENWPRMVQLAYLLFDFNGKKIESEDFIIKPNGFMIPIEVSDIHGISTEKAINEGVELQNVLEKFEKIINKSSYLVSHNMSFDEKIVGAEFLRIGKQNPISEKRKICTMESSTNLCELPGPYGFKWPKLSELYYKLFKKQYDEAHNAFIDVKATAKCFWELQRLDIIKVPEIIKKVDHNEFPLKKLLLSEGRIGNPHKIPFSLVNDYAKGYFQILNLCFSTYSLNNFGSNRLSLDQAELFKFAKDQDSYEKVVVAYANEITQAFKNKNTLPVYNEHRWMFNATRVEIKKAFSLDISIESDNLIYKELKSNQKMLIELIELKISKTNINESINKLTNDYENSKKKNAGCYIATMAYGDYNHPQVLHLRNFRDNYLEKHYFGRIFITAYYWISPKMVAIVKGNKKAIRLSRFILDHIVDIVTMKH